MLEINKRLPVWILSLLKTRQIYFSPKTYFTFEFVRTWIYHSYTYFAGVPIRFMTFHIVFLDWSNRIGWFVIYEHIKYNKVYVIFRELVNFLGWKFYTCRRAETGAIQNILKTQPHTCETTKLLSNANTILCQNE